jgi:hypothetical protein
VSGDAVHDAKPPLVIVRILNPFTKAALRSPLGRRMPLALLRFTGRRSGRSYETPVAWYETDEGPVAFTPAPWRANLDGGAEVTTRVDGHVSRRLAELVTDPEQVARVLNLVVDSGKYKRPAGLKISPGHRVTAADVRSTDRAMLRFHEVQAQRFAQA